MTSANARLLYLHALTPVHSGTGQTAAVIDQPIAREKATGWPMIPGSSLKGVLKDSYQNKLIHTSLAQFVSSYADKEVPEEEMKKKFDDAKKSAEGKAKAIFGDEERAGQLCFGDQRILCLPVRSYFGTFAYITCSHVLKRLQQDTKAMGITSPIESKTVKPPPDQSSILLPKDNSVLANAKVYLEDLDLTVVHDEGLGAMARAFANVLFPADGAHFVARFAVVSDDVFNFLCETSTEIQARVALEENTKTVRRGGLWYEEAVPAESIFCGPVLLADHSRGAENPLDEVVDMFSKASPFTLQIGGNASVGRGLCRGVIA